MVLKEIADLSFMVAFRFYGRYPETGPRYYHPPICESSSDQSDAVLPASENATRRPLPCRRPALATATSLILPNLAAPDWSEFFSNTTLQNFGQFGADGVLPSPAPQSVGAH